MCFSKCASNEREGTTCNTFGIDESAEVGTDENTPVYFAYAKKEKFTGKIKTIAIETRPGK